RFPHVYAQNGARTRTRFDELSEEYETTLGEAVEEAGDQSAGRPPRSVLVQPGYATGDQFGVAAALLGDKELHVVVLGVPEGADSRDKGEAIVQFYRDSGVDPERVHFRRVGSFDRFRDSEARNAVEDVVRGVNPGIALSKGQMKKLRIPVDFSTAWVAEHFSEDLRRTLRHAWGLDDGRFGQEDQAKVADWLAGRGITVEPGREVIVLWSRFSSKRGDVHVEHDTSYRGMEQLLDAVQERTKDSLRRPLVLIAGDSKVNDQRPDHYSAMTAERRARGLDVHDLTDFWTDTDGVRSWGGDTRVGQMRLYEYLHRRSAGRLKHLGFRSGSLEALALAGHGVRYLEEPGSNGGDRMAKWHEADKSGRTARGGLATGYERILITRPPTVSGQIVLGLKNELIWKKQEYKKADTLSRNQEEINRLTEEFQFPRWVVGRDNIRRAEKPVKPGLAKGFADEDVRKITDYLVGAPASDESAFPYRGRWNRAAAVPAASTALSPVAEWSPGGERQRDL
ncbi:hypothetical protein ACFW2X_34705, partial [Streptomyces antibioticus]|uniref:hypothetical protein n=1 Tax=Streptomyces antibioticus TaxID=1890 RepID=UPI0036A1461C